MHRIKMLCWPVLVIGVVLIITPFALSLPSKSSAGQRLLDNFHSLMPPTHVNTTVGYFDRTFVPLRPVAITAVTAGGEIPKLIPALAKPLHMTPAQVQQFLGTSFPATAKLLGELPQLTPVFSKVPPGIAFFKPLVDTMQANVSNYAKVDSLPDFRLFTWFFVVPGVLLVALAGWPLVTARRRAPVRRKASGAERPGLDRAELSQLKQETLR
jgi:hypothetical protein